jgi:hypothetical protein
MVPIILLPSGYLVNDTLCGFGQKKSGLLRYILGFKDSLLFFNRTKKQNLRDLFPEPSSSVGCTLIAV